MEASQETLTSQIPDSELVNRILRGESRLFENLMRRYNPRLYRIGMAILSNDVEVEDAMQTSYINAYEHLAKFENRSSFITWMTRIMLNQCFRQRRKNLLNKFKAEESIHSINMRTPANLLMNKELNNALETAIEQLPEKYRLVFVMREIEDMSIRETSEALSIEEPNVKVRLNRAKIMLRENLNEYMKDHVYSFHLTRCDRIVHNVLGHLKIA
jgi:RNA polymerase sigma factor (sigma-70 family)